MPLDFTELESEIARDETVNGSASTLIEKLADEIEASAGDPAKLADLVARLRANSDSLAAAVEANTGGSDGGTSTQKKRR